MLKANPTPAELQAEIAAIFGASVETAEKKEGGIKRGKITTYTSRKNEFGRNCRRPHEVQVERQRTRVLTHQPNDLRRFASA